MTTITEKKNDLRTSMSIIFLFPAVFLKKIYRSFLCFIAFMQPKPPTCINSHFFILLIITHLKIIFQ